jgi:hypothetical protein
MKDIELYQREKVLCRKKDIKAEEADQFFRRYETKRIAAGYKSVRMNSVARGSPFL